jgi:hypothetical protein
LAILAAYNTPRGSAVNDKLPDNLPDILAELGPQLNTPRHGSATGSATRDQSKNARRIGRKEACLGFREPQERQAEPLPQLMDAPNAPFQADRPLHQRGVRCILSVALESIMDTPDEIVELEMTYVRHLRTV